MLEIDCDGHRSGLRPDDPALKELARLVGDGADLRGLLTHAGESYHATSQSELKAAADNERDSVVRAANRLRRAGHSCPALSVGSTPTAFTATSLDGISDVRAGNFVFFDLVMAGIGVCTPDDIALSIVVTVIGHQAEKGRIITDGDWMATSRDQGPDHGHGLVADLSGELIRGLVMSQANQEHGILTATGRVPELAIVTRLRIVPHHACATAAQHDAYHVVDGAITIEAVWPRVSGW